MGFSVPSTVGAGETDTKICGKRWPRVDAVQFTCSLPVLLDAGQARLPRTIREHYDGCVQPDCRFDRIVTRSDGIDAVVKRLLWSRPDRDPRLAIIFPVPFDKTGTSRRSTRSVWKNRAKDLTSPHR
jgi:hypothetical protein